MKKAKLKVGVAESANLPKFHVVVEIDEAETIEDVGKLSRGHLPNIVGNYMRGRRIELQESEAREKVRELITGRTSAELADAKFQARVASEVQKVIEAFDPTAERKRGGRPAKPVNVQLDPNKKYTVAQMQEILSAAGAKVNFVAVSK